MLHQHKYRIGLGVLHDWLIIFLQLKDESLVDQNQFCSHLKGGKADDDLALQEIYTVY
jgi:hypothetical protein